MVNKSISLACFVLATSLNSGRSYAWSLTNLYCTIFNICTNFWLLSGKSDHYIAIYPIKMVYPMANMLVSLACFLLATSFNNRCDYAKTLTNIYCTNLNICSNSGQISSFWQVRKLPQCNLPALKLYSFQTVWMKPCLQHTHWKPPGSLRRHV